MVLVENELDRILYFGDARRWFILLHGLIKRTDKLSETDIQAAEENMGKHNAKLQEKKGR